MLLREEIDRIMESGYNEPNAEAKLGQDIVLKAIADSGLARNATIKGGVVMRGISNNSRRATQDLDLDFIRYSISDDSIRSFIERLNCVEGLTIALNGSIVELKHQDYQGKRIHISITDTEGTVISLKMDIGVHKDLDIEQEEFAFDVGFQEDAVSLLINSPAQMFTEKLKSMVRFGSRSTRYKDIFDLYYLKDNVRMEQLSTCIRKYIFEDDTLRAVSTMDDVVSRTERVFSNPSYRNAVERSGKNWLDVSVDEVMSGDLEFLKKIRID